jgi:hypothetical protein
MRSISLLILAAVGAMLLSGCVPEERLRQEYRMTECSAATLEGYAGCQSGDRLASNAGTSETHTG